MLREPSRALEDMQHFRPLPPGGQQQSPSSDTQRCPQALPMLPWEQDHSWLRIPEGHRLRAVQQLVQVIQGARGPSTLQLFFGFFQASRQFDGVGMVTPSLQMTKLKFREAHQLAHMGGNCPFAELEPKDLHGSSHVRAERQGCSAKQFGLEAICLLK